MVCCCCFCWDAVTTATFSTVAVSATVWCIWFSGKNTWYIKYKIQLNGPFSGKMATDTFQKSLRSINIANNIKSTLMHFEMCTTFMSLYILSCASRHTCMHACIQIMFKELVSSFCIISAIYSCDDHTNAHIWELASVLIKSAYEEGKMTNLKCEISICLCVCVFLHSHKFSRTSIP